MNSQSRPSEQLLVANVTFKMPGLLMLNQNRLVIEFSVAVPAPGAHSLSLFATHISIKEEQIESLKRNNA